MAKPNQSQLAFNQVGTGRMRKDGVRRALQIVRQRGFVYDGSLAPICIRCGGPRQQKRGLHCDGCAN